MYTHTPGEETDTQKDKKIQQLVLLVQADLSQSLHCSDEDIAVQVGSSDYKGAMRYTCKTHTYIYTHVYTYTQ